MAARTLPTTMMSAGGLLVNPSSGILLGEGNTGSTMNPSSEDTNCFTWATQADDCEAEVGKTSVDRCSDSMKPPPNNHYCAIESLLGVDQELINQVLWCQDSVDDNQGVSSVQQPSFRDSRRPNNNGESYRNEGFDIHDQFFGNSAVDLATVLCEEDLGESLSMIPPTTLCPSPPQVLRHTGAGGSDELEELRVPGVSNCTGGAYEGTANACLALAAGSHRFGVSATSRPAFPPPPSSRRAVTSPDLPKLAVSSNAAGNDDFSQQPVVKMSRPLRPPPTSPSSQACSEDRAVVSDVDYGNRQAYSDDSNDASGGDRKKRMRVSSKTRRPAAQPKELKKAKKALAARKYREDKNNQMRALEDRNKELSSRVSELEQQLWEAIARQASPSHSLMLL